MDIKVNGLAQQQASLEAQNRAESRGKAEGRKNESKGPEGAAPSDSEVEISSRLAGRLSAPDQLKPGAAGPLAESLAETIAADPGAAREAHSELSGERVAQILGGTEPNS